VVSAIAIEPDIGKTARFEVSAASSRGFDSPLPETERDLQLPKTPKGTILTSQRPGSRGNPG
jgi:hypothetical protein